MRIYDGFAVSKMGYWRGCCFVTNAWVWCIEMVEGGDEIEDNEMEDGKGKDYGRPFVENAGTDRARFRGLVGASMAEQVLVLLLTHGAVVC